MNHLGGMEGMVCVEWSCKASMLGKTWESPSPVCWRKLGHHQVQYAGENLVSHLWMATQEQRDLRCQMLRSFKCSHLALWALPGSYRLQELSQMDSWW